MLWKKGRRSDNVEDVRDQGTGGGGGMRFGGGKGLSLMAVVVIVGIGLLTGQDPMQILGQLSGQLTRATERGASLTLFLPVHRTVGNIL